MSDRATDRPDGSEYGPVLSSDVSVSLDDQYSNYVSIRINYPHADSANLRRTLSQYVEEFIYFPHLGKTKENPHYHICIPVKVGDDMIKCVDKYRKYFKMHLKLVGNKHMMCKSMDNGVAKFISYAAREGTTPVSKGDNWAYFIDKAPAWVEPVQQVLFQHSKKVRDPDVPKQITYSNMKHAALRHRLRFELKETDLAFILAHMCTHDGWDMSISVHKGGIPDSEFVWFEKMCKGERDFHQVIKRMRYTPKYLM